MISWLLMLIICLCCYLFFGWLQYRQAQINNKYNYKIDCAVLFPGVSFTTYDSALATSSPVDYLTCYCKDLSLTNLVNSSNSYCTSWQRDYITYQAIPMLISLVIVLVNVVVGRIFRILTTFECQKNA